MIADLLREIFISALVLGGGAFCLIAAIGIVRLPDVYTRMHAASKAVMLGLFLPLGAALLACPELETVIKALAAIFFVVATTPVAAHLIARAAYREGAVACKQTQIDEYQPHSGRLSAVQISLFKRGDI